MRASFYICVPGAHYKFKNAFLGKHYVKMHDFCVIAIPVSMSAIIVAFPNKKKEKYRSHTHYTDNTDLIATWKTHHGDECKTHDFFIRRSEGGKRKLSSKGWGYPSNLSKTSPENTQLSMSPTRTSPKSFCKNLEQRRKKKG